MACVWIASCRLGRSQHANEHHAISMAIYGNLEIQEFEHNNRNGCVCVKLCTLENNTISEKIVMIGMIVAIVIISKINILADTQMPWSCTKPLHSEFTPQGQGSSTSLHRLIDFPAIRMRQSLPASKSSLETKHDTLRQSNMVCWKMPLTLMIFPIISHQNFDVSGIPIAVFDYIQGYGPSAERPLRAKGETCEILRFCSQEFITQLLCYVQAPLRLLPGVIF